MPFAKNGNQSLPNVGTLAVFVPALAEAIGVTVEALGGGEVTPGDIFRSIPPGKHSAYLVCRRAGKHHGDALREICIPEGKQPPVQKPRESKYVTGW